VLEYIKHFPAPNFFALGTALAVIIIMFLWRPKWNAVLPSSLAALIIVSVAAALLKFPVDVIGSIPRTLLPAERLMPKDLLHISAVKSLLFPAVSIAALGMIESLLCGEVASRMKGKEYDGNRDLVAQGIGNMLIPFFGGVPATAAIARTSVGIKAGGETRIVSIVHAAGLLLTIFLLSPIMSRIPVSALAGVLIVTAIRMNDWTTIRYLWKHKFKTSIFEFLLTMTATVVFDLTYAIVIGIIAALIIFVVQVSKVDVIVHDVDQSRFGKQLSAPENFLSGIKIVYFNGPLFFGTGTQLRTRIKNLPGNLHTIVISLRGVPLIDTSGIQVLDDIRLDLIIKHCDLKLTSLQPHVEKMIRRSDFINKIGEDAVYWSADQAIIHMSEDAD
jgi:SulP family sulfate permease